MMLESLVHHCIIPPLCRCCATFMAFELADFVQYAVGPWVLLAWYVIRNSVSTTVYHVAPAKAKCDKMIPIWHFASLAPQNHLGQASSVCLHIYVPSHVPVILSTATSKNQFTTIIINSLFASLYLRLGHLPSLDR